MPRKIEVIGSVSVSLSSAENQLRVSYDKLGKIVEGEDACIEALTQANLAILAIEKLKEILGKQKFGYLLREL